MSATPTVPGTPLPQIVVTSRRALAQSLEDLRDHTDIYARDPIPNCLHHQDIEATKRGERQVREARTRILTLGLRTIQLITASAQDHIFSSIERLKGPDVPLFALTTLARAAAEAVAQLAYLLDAQLTPDERLLRIAATLYHAADDQLKGAREIPEESIVRRAGILERCEQRMRDANALVAAIGCEVVKGKLIHKRTGNSVVIAPKLSELTKPLFPKRYTWYRMASGTAHSRVWSLITAPATIAADGDLQLSPDFLELGGSVQLELETLALIDRLFADYFGHASEPAGAAYRQRVKAVDQLMIRAGGEQWGRR